MGTTTTIRNLYKPAINEEDWGADVNANFDNLDSTIDGIEVQKDAAQIVAEATAIDFEGPVSVVDSGGGLATVSIDESSIEVQRDDAEVLAAATVLNFEGSVSVEDSGGGVATVSVSGIYNDGWVPADETWTYASATTFTISGDVTDIYQAGMKIKLTQTTEKYFYVVGVSFSDPNTTISITAGDDYTLANAAITAPYWSRAQNPVGFPAYFAYTPTYAALGSMTYTSVTTTIARFSVNGNGVVDIWLDANGTTGGSANPTITATAPAGIPSVSIQPGMGFVVDAGTVASFCFIQTATLNIRRYDGANWGLGSGRIFRVHIRFTI